MNKIEALKKIEELKKFIENEEKQAEEWGKKFAKAFEIGGVE